MRWDLAAYGNRRIISINNMMKYKIIAVCLFFISVSLNRTLRLLVICNLLAVMIFSTSCFIKQKINDNVPTLHYRLTITMAPVVNYSALSSILFEFMTTNNQDFILGGIFQDSKFAYRSMSFLFNNEEDLNNFRQRLQSEGIPIQGILVQKLD
jgi:hypothetical protein